MQKSLLSIVQTTCAELNLPQPQSVVNSQDQNVQQLYALLVGGCDDLVNEYDWNWLQIRTTFSTTDGVATYALPSDYVRFINGTCFDQTNRWPMRGPMTPVQWEIITTFQIAVGPFERFRIFGGEINLYPVPGVSSYTFVYDYISRNYVINSNTQAQQSTFQSDSDICVFDHRLVIYGTKLKWMKAKELDTTGAQEDYTRALELFKGQDTPSPRLSMAPNGFRVISSNNYPDGNFNM